MSGGVDNDPAGLALLFLAAVIAGGINAIAGGGTILTFALLAGILPPGPGRLITANVTSKIGLWPGAVAAAWANISCTLSRQEPSAISMSAPG